MQHAARKALRPRTQLTSRDFSSTPSPSFFFNRPAKPTPRKLLGELHHARQQDRLDLVAKLYPSFIDSLQASTSTTPSQHDFEPDEVRRLLRYVAYTNRFRLLLRIFADFPLLGLTPTLQDHHFILVGLAKSGKPTKAFKWLSSMFPTHGIRPRTIEWNLVLDGFKQAEDWPGFDDALVALRESNCRPDVTTYNIIIAACFARGTLDGVRQATLEMSRDRVSPNVRTESTLLSGYVEVGEMHSAGEVMIRLRRMVEAQGKGKKRQLDDPIDTGALNALIKFEVASKGWSGAREKIQWFRQKGFDLDQQSLNTVAVMEVAKAASLTEAIEWVDELEGVIGQPSDIHTWSIMIGQVLRVKGFEEALAVYQEARDRTIIPDSAMIQPLLNSLLLPRIKSRDAFEAAKTLYDDLITSSRAHSHAADISTYVTLLRACADPFNPDLAFSKQLIEDMKQSGARLESQTVTWHIVALMRVATTFEEAFAAYDSIRAAHVDALDVNGYNVLIAAFSSLSFPDVDSAPPPLIREFLSDMRTSGHPPNSYTYSILLTHFAKSENPAAVKAIAHVHSLIKLDSNLDPDTPLFNSLMGAYSRVQAYDIAYSIWESMRGTVGVSHHSVSIILDTLGHSPSREALARGKKVWAMIMAEERAGGLKPNSKNWESWMEFLCRHQLLDEAEKVVFEEMPRAGIEVERSTLETLLKFAMRTGRLDALKERVRMDMPEKWPWVETLSPEEFNRSQVEHSQQTIGRF